MITPCPCAARSAWAVRLPEAVQAYCERSLATRAHGRADAQKPFSVHRTTTRRPVSRIAGSVAAFCWRQLARWRGAAVAPPATPCTAGCRIPAPRRPTLTQAVGLAPDMSSVFSRPFPSHCALFLPQTSWPRVRSRPVKYRAARSERLQLTVQICLFVARVAWLEGGRHRARARLLGQQRFERGSVAWRLHSRRCVCAARASRISVRGRSLPRRVPALPQRRRRGRCPHRFPPPPQPRRGTG